MKKIFLALTSMAFLTGVAYADVVNNSVPSDNNANVSVVTGGAVEKEQISISKEIFVASKSFSQSGIKDFSELSPEVASLLTEKLKAGAFTWPVTGEKDFGFPPDVLEHAVGKELAPYFVDTDKNGAKTVNTEALVYLLLQANKFNLEKQNGLSHRIDFMGYKEKNNQSYFENKFDKVLNLSTPLAIALVFLTLYVFFLSKKIQKKTEEMNEIIARFEKEKNEEKKAIEEAVREIEEIK